MKSEDEVESKSQIQENAVMKESEGNWWVFLSQMDVDQFKVELAAAEVYRRMFSAKKCSTKPIEW